MAKATFNIKRPFCTSKLDWNLRKKLMKCCIRSTALFDAVTWTFRIVDLKYMKSFET